MAWQEFIGGPQEGGKVTPAHSLINLVRSHQYFREYSNEHEDTSTEILESADQTLKDTFNSLPKHKIIDIIHDLTIVLAENPEVDEELLLRLVNTTLNMKPDTLSDE